MWRYCNSFHFLRVHYISFSVKVILIVTIEVRTMPLSCDTTADWQWRTIKNRWRLIATDFNTFAFLNSVGANSRQRALQLRLVLSESILTCR